MRKSMCVGALALSIVVSLVALPAAAARLADDVRALITFDFYAAATEAR